jgi:hypothetical protein
LKPTDLPTYVMGVSVLAVAVVLACVVPVRRAISFDPARLFRS